RPTGLSGELRTTTRTVNGRSEGRSPRTVRRAGRPPADAPITTRSRWGRIPLPRPPPTSPSTTTDEPGRHSGTVSRAFTPAGSGAGQPPRLRDSSCRLTGFRVFEIPDDPPLGHPTWHLPRPVGRPAVSARYGSHAGMAVRASPSTGVTPTAGGPSRSAEQAGYAADHLIALVTRLAAGDRFAF